MSVMHKIIPNHPEIEVEPTYRLINQSKDGLIIASHLNVAGSSEERRRGLLGRDRLDLGEGIYILPCEWLHTFGMRFPIDVAFISSTGKILSVHHALKPYRISKLVIRAQGAIELAAGTLKVTHTSVGDVVQFLNITTGLLQTF